MMISKSLIFASLMLIAGAVSAAPQLDFKPCDTQECRDYFMEYKKYARNHSNAAGILGTMYLVGYGTEVNKEEALRYFKFGATFDDSESALKAGLLLREADPERSLEYLKQAAYLDSANAAYFLARHFSGSDTSSASIADTDKWLAKVVELEHPHVDSLIEKIAATMPVTPESFPSTWEAMEENKSAVLAAEKNNNVTLIKERGPAEIERITVTGMSLAEAMDVGIYSMYGKNGDTYGRGGRAQCRRNDPGCRSIRVTSTADISFN